MKIVTNIAPASIRKIQELISKKAYKDIDEFVSIAVENQLSLELTEQSSSYIDLGLNSAGSSITSAIAKLKIENENSVIVEVDEPEFEDIKYPNITEEKQMWIWGQINKIFPVKFNLRYLFNLLKDGREGIDFEEFCNKASLLGREIGVLLAQYDDKNNRKRDERFSTGFPIGEEKSKSFSRFCSQFIGFKRTDGILSGALFVVKFANLKEDNKKLKIGITKSGLQFAKINNPIFDEGYTDVNLSEEEIDFYLSHIVKKVPGEAMAFYLILDLINKGAKERNDLNQRMKEIVPNSWSDALINTQRAGAMSRLYELGLIRKNKNGIFVEYEISNKGREFLQKYIKDRNEYVYDT